jgi:hypothetical protein
MRVELFRACLLLLVASPAHASGDPIVIYVVAGGGLAQLALVVFMLTARAFRSVRLPALATYLLYLVVLWAWVWNSRQSATTLGAGLIVLPCLVVGTLLWLLVTAGRRSGAAG